MAKFQKGVEYVVFGKQHKEAGVCRLVGISDDGSKGYFVFYPSPELNEIFGVDMKDGLRRTLNIIDSDSSHRQFCQKYNRNTDRWLTVFSDNI